MGTWDVGPFDNDGACDWAWELEESDGVDVLRAALNPEVSYVEAPEGEVAIAAAAVLTAFIGEAVGVPDEIADWVDSHRHLDVRSLKTDALIALDAVVSADSELVELWDESEDSASWRATVDQIRRVLDSEWPAPSVSAPPATASARSAQAPTSKPWWQFWR